MPEEIDGRGPLPGPVTRTRKVRADGKGLEQKVRFVPYAWRGDKLYRAKEKAGLFVIMQGRRLRAEVTRQDFENVTAPLLARTRTLTESAVAENDAGSCWFSDVLQAQ